MDCALGPPNYWNGSSNIFTQIRRVIRVPRRLLSLIDQLTRKKTSLDLLFIDALELLPNERAGGTLATRQFHHSPGQGRVEQANPPVVDAARPLVALK